MMFAKPLRKRVASGEIICSVRLWKSPRVRIGGRYALPGGAIVVTGVTEIDLGDITDDLARRSGFAGVEDLMATARHGCGERVFMVEFSFHGAGATALD